MNDIDWSKPNAMQSYEDVDWSKPNVTQSDTGWGSIGRDISNIPSGLYNLAKHGISQTYPETLGLGEQAQKNPINLLKEPALAGIQGIYELYGLPGALRDYLGKKEVIPKGTPSFRLPESILPKEFPEEYYRGKLGLGEKKPGSTLAQLLPVGIPAAKGSAMLGKGAATVAKASPEVAKLGAQLTGEGIKKGAESVKKVYEKATERSRKVSEIEAQERALKKELHALKKQVPETQIERSSDIQKIIDAELAKRESTSSGIKPYTVNEKEKKIGSLASALKEAREKITKPLKEEWQQFSNSEKMHKAVLEPIEIKGFEHQYGNPEEYASKGLQKIIKKVVGHKEHIPAHTDIIQGAVPGKDVYHQARPLLKDVADLYRSARDEAADWTRESKNLDRLPHERKAAGAKADSLRKIASDARKRLEGYLEPQELKEFKKLEHRFEHEEIPWRESSLLEMATSRHAKIAKENFAEALVNENYPHLRKILMEQHPGVKEAMAQYDLRGFDVSNPKEIHKLLNSDQGRALPEKLQADLRDMAASVESEKELLKLRSKLTKGEIINKINSKELKGILNKHPELAEPFTSDLDRRTKIRELQNHLKDLGLSKEEVEANLTKFEKAIGWAKKGARYIPGGAAATALVGLLM